MLTYWQACDASRPWGLQPYDHGVLTSAGRCRQVDDDGGAIVALASDHSSNAHNPGPVDTVGWQRSTGR